jgi:hypothetical protein
MRVMLVIHMVVIYFEAKVRCKKKPLNLASSKGDCTVTMLVMEKQVLLMLWMIVTNDWSNMWIFLQI